jgi:hypothetical protein
VFGVDKGTTTMTGYAAPPSEKIVAFAKKFGQP